MFLPLSLGIFALTIDPNATSFLPTPTQNLSQDSWLLSGRLCKTIWSDCKYSHRWAQVKTSSGGLNIRSSPNGAVIGEIPNGWQIVIGKYDPSRRWAYVYQWRRGYARDSGFRGAPKFRSNGWVSVDYLVPLGEYCMKPLKLSLLPLSHPMAEFQPQESLEDIILAWLNRS